MEIDIESLYVRNVSSRNNGKNKITLTPKDLITFYMYFFIFWYNVLSVSTYQRLLTTYWLNLHIEYWFPMLLFCNVSRVEHNQMIWDFSVLKSICVSFINIIIFKNHLLLFCILNFCFVFFCFCVLLYFCFHFLVFLFVFSFVLLSIFFLFF
jgi:hypothetical protein